MRLCDRGSLRLFRKRVDGADIYQTPYAVLHSHSDDFPCSAHIDLIHFRPWTGGHRYDTRTMQYAGAAVCSLEKRRKRIFYTYIADDCIHPPRK